MMIFEFRPTALSETVPDHRVSKSSLNLVQLRIFHALKSTSCLKLGQRYAMPGRMQPLFSEIGTGGLRQRTDKIEQKHAKRAKAADSPSLCFLCALLFKAP
jgi:hypothetical protein